MWSSIGRFSFQKRGTQAGHMVWTVDFGCSGLCRVLEEVLLGVVGVPKLLWAVGTGASTMPCADNLAFGGYSA